MLLRKGPIMFVRPYSSDISCLQSIEMDGEYSRYFNVMPGDIVIDIGANIGSFSVPAAFREPEAHFFAIEPMPENFRLLSDNISINKLTNIKSIFAGISDKKEGLVFYRGKGTWFASGSMYKMDAIDENKKETVQCVTIADIFTDNNLKTCDFLKMDCEGAEYKILFNCPDDIWKKIKKIALEFHNFEEGKNQFDIIKLLEEKGFRAVLPKKYKDKKIGLIFAIKL